MVVVKLRVKHGLFDKRERYAKFSPFTPFEDFTGELLPSEKRGKDVVIRLKDYSFKPPFVREIKQEDVICGWKL